MKVIRCDPPTQRLVGLGGIGDAARVELRSNNFKIEVAVDTCSIYTTQHSWRAFSADCSGDEVSLPAGLASDGPTLAFWERSMGYGLYCLVLTSQYSEAPAASQISVMLQIEESALVALIDGGDSRTVTRVDPVTIDGSTSYDPDLASWLSQGLTYTWFCSSRIDAEQDSGSSSSEESSGLSGAYCDVINDATSDVIEVPEGSLTPNHIYNITLVVSQAQREAGSMTQMVRTSCIFT